MRGVRVKELVLTFYEQQHLRPDWKVDVGSEDFRLFLQGLVTDMKTAGIAVSWCRNRSFCIDVKSYADLLNAVRISSPADNLAAVCVGHIIGKSEHLDLQEDIRRAVRRVAFAPETIEPDDQNRRVCHNCGCGC